MAGGAVVVVIIVIVCIAVVISVGGFDWGVYVRERESGAHRLTADVRSPLGGERMKLGAVVLCTEGLVRVGVFRTGYVSSIGTDSGLDAGEFLAKGCFGIGEGLGEGRV